MTTVGDIIEGKYEVLKMIGKGGMSKVYLAMDKRLNKQWAVKVMKKNVTDKNGEMVIQRAIAEADLIKQLDHPSIVRIVDIIDIGDEICIIEDYIEGETLRDVIEISGAQPQDRVIDWAKQIASALEYLHTRNMPIIYRDMKPANVMVKPDGTIKIIDFGIAREYKDKNIADTETLGTKGYAAPEQFGGKGQTDARTDIYCLGVTLYHLITGKSPCEPPYEIYPIRYWNPQLSAGLEAIILKCIELNPMNRYQSCVELMYALNHYEEHSVAYRKKQKAKLRSFIITSAATVLAVGVGVTSLIMGQAATDADYDQQLILARAETDPIVKGEYYSNAIDIKPYETQAYVEMVDAFKDDRVFTQEEAEILSKKVNANKVVLLEQQEYPELAFEIGKLYWNYYDYGTSEGSESINPVGMKSALPYFKEAVDYGGENTDYYLMSKVYHDIADFNKNVEYNAEEGQTSDYGLYWEMLEDLFIEVNNSQDESSSGIVELEAYKLILKEIEINAKRFYKEGISKETMTQMIDDIQKELEILNPEQGTKPDEIHNELISRLETVRTAVKNAGE